MAVEAGVVARAGAAGAGTGVGAAVAWVVVPSVGQRTVASSSTVLSQG